MPDNRSPGEGSVFSKEHPAPALSLILRIPVSASPPQAWGRGEGTVRARTVSGGCNPQVYLFDHLSQNRRWKAALKIPEWLPSASQATRLQVAGRPLWPRKSRDSGDCGEQAAGSWQNREIRGKRAAKGKAGGRRMSEESTAQPPLAGAKVLRI